MLELSAFADEFFDSSRQVLERNLEQVGRRERRLFLLPNMLQGTQARKSLDSSNSRRDTRLGDHLQQTDIACRSSVSAAAEFGAALAERDALRPRVRGDDARALAWLGWVGFRGV